ncbi:MAG TPA: hypothetical protein VLD36_13700, partial [Burkholderiales bacterium]|nr:hypothetical protein [Burkholderiales bacterium]
MNFTFQVKSRRGPNLAALFAGACQAPSRMCARSMEQGQRLQLFDRRAVTKEEETLMRCTPMRLIPLTASLLGVALFAPATF